MTARSGFDAGPLRSSEETHTGRRRVAPGRHAQGTTTVERSTREQAGGALVFAAITVAVASLGSVATSGGQDWYEQLDRPSFTPPDAVFGTLLLNASIVVLRGE